MMTPREGSQLCIKMAGYGIRHDVVQAIQDDALNSLLNRLLAATTRIENGVEYPMTVQERIDYVLDREKKKTEAVIRINELAAKKVGADDEEFMVNDWAGGNIDDAFSLGVDAGQAYLARELKAILS